MKVKTRFKNMDIFERAAGFLKPRLDRQIWFLRCCWLYCSLLGLRTYQVAKTRKLRRRARRRNNTRSKRPRTCGSW